MNKKEFEKELKELDGKIIDGEERREKFNEKVRKCRERTNKIKKKKVKLFEKYIRDDIIDLLPGTVWRLDGRYGVSECIKLIKRREQNKDLINFIDDSFSEYVGYCGIDLNKYSPKDERIRIEVNLSGISIKSNGNLDYKKLEDKYSIVISPDVEVLKEEFKVKLDNIVCFSEMLRRRGVDVDEIINTYI